MTQKIKDELLRVKKKKTKTIIALRTTYILWSRFEVNCDYSFFAILLILLNV